MRPPAVVGTPTKSLIRRLCAGAGVLACALISLPSGAAAAQPAVVKGTVTAVEPLSLTIQTAGRRTGMINALTDAAHAVTAGDYPYVWGGGHAQAGLPGIGIKGPGHNGHRVGYDCSGSVAAVLAGAGLWPAGSPVPSDAGVISQLLQENIIARGPGTSADEVTLYDQPGVHIFMNIDGRFFGTSDGGGGNPSQPKGGAGWLADGAPDAYSRRFKRYHLLASVLRDRTTYGHSFTFQVDPSAGITAGVAPGDVIQVSFELNSSGSMVASAVGYVGAVTAGGSVTSIAPDGSSFAVQTAGGQTLTFSTGTNTSLVDALAVGDGVQVSYTSAAGGAMTARSVTVTAPAPVTQPTGGATGTAPAPGDGPYGGSTPYSGGTGPVSAGAYDGGAAPYGGADQ